MDEYAYAGLEFCVFVLVYMVIEYIHLSSVIFLHSNCYNSPQSVEMILWMAQIDPGNYQGTFLFFFP